MKDNTQKHLERTKCKRKKKKHQKEGDKEKHLDSRAMEKEERKGSTLKRKVIKTSTSTLEQSKR